MDKVYQLCNNKIKVSIQEGLIRLKSDKALWTYLDGATLERTLSLVKLIKADYINEYKRALNISNDSLVVEIWAHVYSHYFGLLINRNNKIKWLKKLLAKGINRAEIIDCGEKQIDTNRWFWDLISVFKLPISWFTPKNIANRKLIS
ncbi:MULTISPECIES: hypothetical protein [unclassified Pedobacter]|uniref:hypothetical protein n=1 Tax=unclassified Pedobacter TaxID=2628915 RepID=UPI001E325051|nr:MULTISPECIES: hypothetical protein [unclassified Pedobacter]